MSQPFSQKIELVVIQPSPFCNIDCRYCYLPDRGNRKVLEEATLAKIYERLFASAHLGDRISILWHAGEPLAVPIAFYEKAFALLAQYNVKNIPVRQLFQTNCTLITQEWCDFFKRHQAHIGVSIDGPQRIHDANRVTRSGKGTFERAIRGVKLLQANGILLHNIGVLTSTALDHPDEMWDFFMGLGITHLAFNVEETEGANTQSSVRHAADVARYQAFFRRFRQLRKASGRDVRIRELDNMEERVRFVSGELQSALNQPMGTLSFDCEGNISTFSPELVTMRHSKYEHFKFGNVFDGAVDDILESPRFRATYDDIRRGVAKCRAACPYFSLCGGGEPVNKLGENGTFDSMETMHCRTIIQGLCDVVLEGVEETLGIPSPPAPAVPVQRVERLRHAGRRCIPLEMVLCS